MTSEHLDDQVLSAILDGEESPSAHLDGCGACRARSEQLLAAARLMGTAVPPPDPQRREAAIAVALAAHRPARVRWRPSTGALAAAALVLAIAALLPLLLTRGGGGSDVEQANRVADGDNSSTAGLGSGGASEAAGGASIMAAPAGPVMAGDLGPIAAGHELRDRVADAIQAGPKAAPDTPISCETELRSMDQRAGRLVLFGQATVNERSGFVLVFEVPDSESPKLTAYVVDQEDCAQVLQFVSFTAP